MSDLSSFLAFMIFVAVMTGTPGPGNLAFMAIGAQIGVKAALPPILGAVLAAICMNILIAQGLGAVLAQGGPLTLALKVASMAYMLYLAWRVLTMARAQEGKAKALSFWEGTLIHPLSPKTWAMGVIGYSVYFTPSGSLWDETFLLAAGFAMGGLVFHSSWALAGASIMRLLGQGRAFQFFTGSMAALMVGSTAWSLWLQG
ncbi:MAG: LysE family transporter [Cohaesibacter sp.]|jgi:threonine/homoserine/homoserine lactone efflux protein|nr:LysE family transporter [Cohaesibacter sp.]